MNDFEIDVYKLFQIKHQNFKTPTLTPSLILSPPGGGKSVLMDSLDQGVINRNEKMEIVRLRTSYIDELYNLDCDDYKEAYEAVQNADIILCDIDDALFGSHSRGSGSKVDHQLNFAVIRHHVARYKLGVDLKTYFRDKKGLPPKKRCSVILQYGLQRYQILSPMERDSASMIFAKAVDLDPDHLNNMFSKMFGKAIMEKLRKNSYDVHIMKNQAAMGKYAVKPKGHMAGWCDSFPVVSRVKGAEEFYLHPDDRTPDADSDSNELTKTVSVNELGKIVFTCPHCNEKYTPRKNQVPKECNKCRTKIR